MREFAAAKIVGLRAKLARTEWAKLPLSLLAHGPGTALFVAVDSE